MLNSWLGLVDHEEDKGNLAIGVNKYLHAMIGKRFLVKDAWKVFAIVEIPSKKNQNANLINNYLLSKGIAVRYLLSYGLENALRITLGTKEDLNKTIEAMKEFVRNNE